MRKAIAAVLALAVVAAILALVYTQAHDGDRTPVTREQLIHLGMRLDPPDPDQPVIARERAEAVARSHTPKPILGSVLASCLEGDAEVGYPCWVVSHDSKGYVSSAPPGSRGRPADYLVSIIDSRTSAWVAFRAGSGANSK